MIAGWLPLAHGSRAMPAAEPSQSESPKQSLLADAGPDVPPAGAGNARINLWLFGGDPPADGQDVEVVVTGFEFVGGGE